MSVSLICLYLDSKVVVEQTVPAGKVPVLFFSVLLRKRLRDNNDSNNKIHTNTHTHTHTHTHNIHTNLCTIAFECR